MGELKHKEVKLKLKTEISNIIHRGVRISELIRLLEEYKEQNGNHLLVHLAYGAGTFDMRHNEKLEPEESDEPIENGKIDYEIGE